MRFLADMGISMVTVYWLRELGYSAKHLREERLHKLPDNLILKKAKEEERILLTCDLDFGYLLFESKDSSPTTIIFRLEYQTALNHIHRLKKLFDDYSIELQSHSVISIDDKKIRFRSLPIN
jgi:predicted nuclease of predicted toxin-antitoxin system